MTLRITALLICMAGSIHGSIPAQEIPDDQFFGAVLEYVRSFEVGDNPVLAPGAVALDSARTLTRAGTRLARSRSRVADIGRALGLPLVEESAITDCFTIVGREHCRLEGVENVVSFQLPEVRGDTATLMVRTAANVGELATPSVNHWGIELEVVRSASEAWSVTRALELELHSGTRFSRGFLDRRKHRGTEAADLTLALPLSALSAEEGPSLGSNTEVRVTTGRSGANHGVALSEAMTDRALGVLQSDSQPARFSRDDIYRLEKTTDEGPSITGGILGFIVGGASGALVSCFILNTDDYGAPCAGQSDLTFFLSTGIGAALGTYLGATLFR